MVYKISEKQKIFFDVLVLAVLFMSIGFFAGFFTEVYRTGKVVENYKDNEIQALDLKLQNYYYQIMSKESCDAALTQNFIFADKLYSEGLKIEKYEEANQITADILLEKKRYVLLKTELWLNTILLKEKCNKELNTIVYFYSHDPPSNSVVATQKIISNVLRDVKDQKGNSVVLLPIAADMDLEIVNLQRKIYNITELPSILINEDVKLEGYSSEKEILSYLNK